jgi:hypothetical protein
MIPSAVLSRSPKNQVDNPAAKRQRLFGRNRHRLGSRHSKRFSGNRLWLDGRHGGSPRASDRSAGGTQGRRVHRTHATREYLCSGHWLECGKPFWGILLAIPEIPRHRRFAILTAREPWPEKPLARRSYPPNRDRTPMPVMWWSAKWIARSAPTVPRPWLSTTSRRWAARASCIRGASSSHGHSDLLRLLSSGAPYGQDFVLY